MSWYWWLLAGWLFLGSVAVLGFVVLTRRPVPWSTEPDRPVDRMSRRDTVVVWAAVGALALVAGPIGTVEMARRWGIRLHQEDMWRTDLHDFG